MARVEKPLPESLLKAITLVCASPMPRAQMLEAVVLMVHGFGLWAATEGQIDPTAFAIPEEQWKAIGTMLQPVGSDAIGGVNLALSWMNYGPSSYKPEEVTGG